MKEKSFNRNIARFGHAIRILRDKKKMTQEALAGKAGIDRKHLRNIEQGKHSVGLDVTFRILDGLGVNPFEAFTLAWEKEYKDYIKEKQTRAEPEGAGTQLRKQVNVKVNEQDTAKGETFQHSKSCGGGQRCYNCNKLRQMIYSTAV